MTVRYLSERGRGEDVNPSSMESAHNGFSPGRREVHSPKFTETDDI
jgi:hypothetical protein